MCFQLEPGFLSGSLHHYTKESSKTIMSNFWYTLALGRDLRGYNIGPHTDTSDKWVTTLYYLPDSNAQTELGTAVVASKSGRTSSGNVRGSLSSGDFYIARKAKFQKNAVFAFAACTGSWHAVQQVKGSDAIQRDTIQGFVNAPPRGGKKQCG